MDCPKCRAANPDSSHYCGTCAAPLPGPPGSSVSAATPAGTVPPAPSAADEAASLTTTIDPLERGLRPGTLVAGGKYRILGEIGRGAMGIVYEADDLKLKRTIALKFLPAELLNDAEARERFSHEAQAASTLDNPHICTVYDIGESEDRRMFIAMTLCRGESLRTRIRRGPLSPAEALSIAAQVADGLATAHAHGVIHRDVKPANILLSGEGQARVADFGLAKITGEARLTRAGRAVGTVAYMSPEQLRGEDADARSDVWSLGVVLYEMLTGALPFRGTTEHSLAYDIVNGEPKPLSALPPGTPAGCARILEKALAKAPDDRFDSAVEMADAIADVRASEGYSGHVRTRSPSASSRDRALDREARRRRSLVRTGLIVLAAGAALSVLFALRVPVRVVALLGLGRPPGGRHITIFTPVVLGEGQPDRVLAAGLAEYLRRRLDEIARQSHSWVTPGDHNAAYEVRESADALRVLGSNVVVTGTLRRSGDNLVLTLDVFDPVRQRRLDSFSKSDHVANIATWQDDLVRDGAAAVGLPASPGAGAGRSGQISTGTTVPGAFEAYIRGLGLLTATSPGPGAGTPEYEAALDESIAAFEEAIRIDPSFADASLELAEADRLRAASGKDKSPARRAEAVARSVIRSNDQLARAHFVLGRILGGLDRDQEAGPELERAVALDPLFFDAQIRLAQVFEATNQRAKAEAAYRAALVARPDYWAARIYLGIFELYQVDHQKALDEFENAARLCPGNFVILNDLAAVLFKMGAYDRSVAASERSNAIKRNPDACSNLAVLYYFSGRYADSVTMSEAAIGFGPSDFSNLIWGNLADAYHFTPGNQAKSDEAYRKAIEMTEGTLAADPADSRARAFLAVALAKTGQADRAGTEIANALKAKPGDSDIVLHAVYVYEIVGARARALEALREYVKLKGPTDEIVRDPYLAGLRQDPGYADILKK